MRQGKILGLVLWWACLTVAAVMLEDLVKDVPLYQKALLVFFLAVVALPLMFMDNIRGWKLRSSFDMPILAAIEHMVQTVADSWDSIDKTEEAFWRAIHKQMVAGRLRVMGAEAPGEEIKRISKKHLSGLKPV